jgi:hypothetical protein
VLFCHYCTRDSTATDFRRRREVRMYFTNCHTRSVISSRNGGMDFFVHIHSLHTIISYSVIDMLVKNLVGMHATWRSDCNYTFPVKVLNRRQQEKTTDIPRAPFRSRFANVEKVDQISLVGHISWILEHIVSDHPMASTSKDSHRTEVIRYLFEKRNGLRCFVTVETE